MTPAGGGQGVPDVTGLVEAVREWVESEVLAGAEGRDRFLARVAANVLGIVERELALGPDQEIAQRAGLARLGVGGEAELASAIREGRFDARLDEVRAHLVETTRGRLLVANPRYLEA